MNLEDQVANGVAEYCRVHLRYIVQEVVQERMTTELQGMPSYDEQRCNLGKAFRAAVVKVLNNDGTAYPTLHRISALEKLAQESSV